MFTRAQWTIYLNSAVYILEARLNALAAAVTDDEEPFAFEIDYGERVEHCWNGEYPHALSSRTPLKLLRAAFLMCYGAQATKRTATTLRGYATTPYLDKIMARIKGSAPEGADTSSWRY